MRTVKYVFSVLVGGGNWAWGAWQFIAAVLALLPVVKTPGSKWDRAMLRELAELADAIFGIFGYWWLLFIFAIYVFSVLVHKIRCLEKDVEPTLKIRFVRKDASPYWTVVKNENGEKIGRVYSVEVVNSSKKQDIKGVRLVVREAEGAKLNLPNEPLEPVSGPPKFDLGANGCQVVKIIFAKDGSAFPNAEICYASGHKVVPKDGVKLMLEAQGENVPSASAWFALRMTPGGKVDMWPSRRTESWESDCKNWVGCG